MKDLLDDPDVIRDSNLRDALRSATSAPHARLDGQLAGLDLTDPRARRDFCDVQRRGFSRLGEACHWHAAEASDALIATLRALDVDLGRPLERSGPGRDLPLHSDAVAYLLLGSQLGAAMLRRSMPEPPERGYFALPPARGAWRALCQRLSAQPARCPEAQRVLRDAIRAFSIFEYEARAVLTAPTAGAT
ncbi:hypothetical protein AYJ57_12135 [Salipiger sp. CCB-MM3]|uniref:hypothetical protein n=1 Tax=Salipiger sp. CCB-MM3 TaxID=1792508 RepID=UPI00080ABBAE|nr:hypothetical protein [Salipiger sp. CCB-MM3]ANT61048.1 hypothetical protein AYJ57_12135 [Salipiger sp. CCB-MM3]